MTQNCTSFITVPTPTTSSFTFTDFPPIVCSLNFWWNSSEIVLDCACLTPELMAKTQAVVLLMDYWSQKNYVCIKLFRTNYRKSSRNGLQKYISLGKIHGSSHCSPFPPALGQQLTAFQNKIRCCWRSL